MSTILVAEDDALVPAEQTSKLNKLSEQHRRDQRRMADRQLEQRLRFEQLVARISSELAGTIGSETDAAINRALGAVGSFAGADRAYVFQSDAAGTHMDNTHEWCAVGVAPLLKNLHQIPLAEEFSWLAGQLRKHLIFQVSDVNSLPPEAQREHHHFKAQGICSVLMIPLTISGGLAGFVGFDDTHTCRTWSDDDCNLLRFIGNTINHVIERNKAAKEQEKLHAKLTNAVEMARLGQWEYDAGGYFTFNDQFYKIFHTTAEQVGGYTLKPAEYFRRFIHPDDLTLVQQHGRQAIKTKEPICSRQLEHRILYADGGVGHIIVRYTTLKDGQGRTVKTYGVNQDITEQKKAAAAHEKLRDQFMQSQKMESVGRLAGGVAHDFNNMLGIIIGHAELAMEQVPPASPVYSDLAEIRKAAMKSADLTRQLLAFARKQIVSPVAIDLNDKVTGMIKMFRRLIGENIDLAWMPGDNLWPVKMDPAQTDQLLANLCVNARDAISGVGKISIETGNIVLDEAFCAVHAGSKPGQHVFLSISDNGCGMDEETLKNLFEPFFTTKDLGKGTGLGLSTVYGIVKQNDGFIDVISQPGQGSEFRIYLPRCLQNADPFVKPTSKSIVKGAETVLLVEDEGSILRLAKIVLERLGYTVLAAPSPQEALTIAQQYQLPIHLLITDVVMPQMNGRQLSERIRRSRPAIKVIFMSGYTANTVAHQGILENDLHFLQKPFSNNALAEMVREVMDENS